MKSSKRRPLRRGEELALGPQTRFFRAGDLQVDLDKRTVRYPFSSEVPVLRWWGWEILDHGKAKSARMDRVRAGASSLLNHDPDQWVGDTSSPKLEKSERRWWVTTTFGVGQQADDLLENLSRGLRRNVSFLYRNNVLEATKAPKGWEKPDPESLVMGWLGPEPAGDREVPWFRVVDWDVLEVGFVSIPADFTVGPGRSAADVRAAFAPALSALAKRELPVEPVAVRWDAAEDEDATERLELAAGRRSEGIIVSGRFLEDDDDERQELEDAEERADEELEDERQDEDEDEKREELEDAELAERQDEDRGESSGSEVAGAEREGPDPDNGGDGRETEETMDPEEKGQKTDAAAVERGRTAEKSRIAELFAIGEEFKGKCPKAPELAQKAVAEDQDANWLKNEILRNLPKPEDRGESSPAFGGDSESYLDLPAKDLRKFSIRKLILSQIERDAKIAPFELECSKTIAERLGKSPNGRYIPNDVLADPGYSRYLRAALPFMRGPAAMRAELQVGAGTGGNLVGTELLAASFIEVLRNRAVTMRAGVIPVDGLVGNIDIPRQASGGTFYWVAEGAGPAGDADPTFDVVPGSPNTGAAKQPISRRLLMQSTPAVEGLIRDDLVSIVGLGIDAGTLIGSGGTQPQGIAGATGVGDVDHGTNGGPPTWPKAVEFETDVADANADMGALAYVTTSKVRGKLKTVEKASGTAEFLMKDGMMNDYPVFVTNQLRNDRTQGSGSNLSEMIFGNWRDVLLLMWGALDLEADKATNADSGGLVLRAFQDVDVAIRHGASFSYSDDIDAS